MHSTWLRSGSTPAALVPDIQHMVGGMSSGTAPVTHSDGFHAIERLDLLHQLCN